MRFDLSDLALFVQVVDSGSITGGAERSRIALASASNRLKAMEDALGASLLVRERRGVSPTPAGAALMRHARPLLRQHQKMRAELAEFTTGLKGNIRMLCNTASLSGPLPEELSSFLEAHPNVNIDLEERLSHEIVAALVGESADIGILADSVDTADLEIFSYSHDQMTIVAAPAHPIAARGSISFSEVLDHDFIGFQEGGALQEYLAERAARMGKQFRFRVRLGSFDTICRMVARNIGIGLVPEAVALRLKEPLGLRTVSLLDPWASRKLIICVRQLSQLPVPAQHLVDQLRLPR